MLDMLPPVRLSLAHLPTPLEPLARSPLFEGIAEDMTEEEIALSKSTPGYQMD